PLVRHHEAVAELINPLGELAFPWHESIYFLEHRGEVCRVVVRRGDPENAAGFLVEGQRVPAVQVDARVERAESGKQARDAGPALTVAALRRELAQAPGQLFRARVDLVQREMGG